MSYSVNLNGPRYPSYQAAVYQPPAVVTTEVAILPGGAVVKTTTTTTTQVMPGEPPLVAGRQIPGRPAAVVSRNRIPPHSGNNSGTVDFSARTGQLVYRK